MVKADMKNVIKIKVLLLAALGLGLLTVLMAPSASAAPQTFVVNNGAAGFGDCYTVTPGQCTLSSAIAAANGNSNPSDQDVIEFDIPGAGPHTIYAGQGVSESYIITQSVFIDGYTQPGAQANTNPYPQPFNGTLMIEIDGTDASTASGVFAVYSDNVKISGLVINRARQAQLIIGGDNAEITGTYLGTDITGMMQVFNPDPNGDDPLYNTPNADNLKVGGPNPGDRNVITGYAGFGVGGAFGAPLGDPTAPHNTVIQGNNFYVASDGVTPLPPQYLDFTSSLTFSNLRGLKFGGDNEGEGNLVENLTGAGIAINDGSDDVVIAGNRIVGNGLANNSSGIEIYNNSHNIRIGGTSQYSRNVIADNSAQGINIVLSEDITILGNYIGVHEDGISQLENNGDGITINQSNGIRIGSSASGGRNVITAPAGYGRGISIQNGSEDITIQNNAIGVGSDETTALPSRYGIELSSSSHDVLIGGAAVDEGNIIANNAQAGIVLRANDNQDISILGNKIYENDGLGVDIYDDGPTLNDNLDADTGANTILNFPRVITPQTISGGDTDIMYTTNLPAGDYRIEFFSNTTADPSGYGEGEAFMGFQNITSTGTGEQIFNTSIVGTSFANIRATATLIDPSTSSGFGPTSEFGDQTTAPTDIAISKTITNLEDVTPGGVIEYDISFINNGPFPAQLADFSDAISGKLLFADHAAPDLMPADEGAFAGLPGSFVISDTGNADVTCAWLGPGSSGSVIGLVAYGDHGAIVCYYSGSDTILASGDSIDVHLRFNVDSGSNLKFSNYVISSAPISTSDPDVAAIGSATADELLDRNPDVNNVAIASTTGLNVDLSLDKTLQDPEDFAQGGTITYQISLNNLGPDWFDPSIYDDFFSRQIFVDYVDPDITPANLGGPGPAPGITVIADTGNPDIECLWGDHGSAPFLGAPDHPDYGLIFCRYIGDEVVKSGESISAEIDLQIANDSDLSFNNYAFNAGTLIVQGGDPDDAEIMTVYNSGGDILSGFIQAGGNINNFAVGQPPVDIGVTATFVNPEDVAVGNTIYYDVTLLNRGPGAVDMGYFNDFSRGILGGAFAAANLDIVGAVGSDFICADAGSGSIQYLGVAAQDHTNYSVYMCMYSGSGQVLAAGESQTIRLAFTVTDPADGFNFYAINASFSTDPGMNTFTNEFYGATEDVLDTFTHDNFARVAYTLTGNGGGGTSNNGTGGSNSASSGGDLSATGQSRLVIVAIAATLLAVGVIAALTARKRQLKQ